MKITLATTFLFKWKTATFSKYQFWFWWNEMKEMGKQLKIKILAKNWLPLSYEGTIEKKVRGLINLDQDLNWPEILLKFSNITFFFSKIIHFDIEKWHLDQSSTNWNSKMVSKEHQKKVKLKM